MKFWFKEDATFDKLMVSFFYLGIVGVVILIVLTVLGIAKPPPPPFQYTPMG